MAATPMPGYIKEQEKKASVAFKVVNTDVDDPNTIRLIRPNPKTRGNEDLEPLYTFDLPLINGTKWVDVSPDDRKSADVSFQVRLGGKKEPETQVVAGRMPPLWEPIAAGMRDGNTSYGDILFYRNVSGTEDFEWVETEYILRKNWTMHRFVRIVRDPKRRKDAIVYLSTAEKRVPELKDALWGRIRDTFKRLS